MKEKLRFGLAQVVEVFVEAVETLRIHGFTENGMKDAGCAAGNLGRFCIVKDVKNNYCHGGGMTCGHPFQIGAAER